MILFPVLDVDSSSGGIRTIYRMVDVLDDAGIDAAVWHGAPGFSCTWFEHRTRIVWGERRELAVGDVLVLPEIGGSRYRELVTGAKVVILNQNHFHTLRDGFPWASAERAAYPDFPEVVAAVATSREIARLLDRLTPGDFPVLRAPVAVDAAMFAAGEDPSKERLISFMDFRRPRDSTLVAQLLLRSGALRAGWRIEMVEGLPPPEVARVLGRSAIFMSFAGAEGFSLPGAEAMAAGCHVVGFDGGGGAEYLLPDLSTPVPDPDVVGFADAVLRAVEEFDHDRDAFDARAARARDFVRTRYGERPFREGVLATFAALEELGVGQDEARWVRHYRALRSRPPVLERLHRRVRRALTRRPAPPASPAPPAARSPGYGPAAPRRSRPR